MEKLTFQGEDGTTEEFYVLEQTRVGGELSAGSRF